MNLTAYIWEYIYTKIDMHTIIIDEKGYKFEGE